MRCSVCRYRLRDFIDLKKIIRFEIKGRKCTGEYSYIVWVLSKIYLGSQREYYRLKKIHNDLSQVNF